MSRNRKALGIVGGTGRRSEWLKGRKARGGGHRVRQELSDGEDGGFGSCHKEFDFRARAKGSCRWLSAGPITF